MMENDLFSLYQNNQRINLKDKTKSIISSICPCQCNCDCHKNITYNTSKNKTQIKKLNNNIFNLKLNQEIPHKSIPKSISNITKKEYTFDPMTITNSTEPNQNIITSSNLQDLNSINNNGYILYRNDIKDFNIFLDALHKIKNKKIEETYKGINKKYINNNNYNLNKRIDKKMIIDDKRNKSFNNVVINEILFDKGNNVKKNFHSLSNDHIGNNIVRNNTQKNYIEEKDLYYNSKNEQSHVLNNIHKINNNIKKNKNENLNKSYNYTNNYYKKTNYHLEEKCNTNENYRISPLGHIVDNFVTMLKDKNEYKNKIFKNNTKIQTQKNWYNKYNEDIMIKKRKLEDMCLNDNKLNSNNLGFDTKMKEFSSENNTKRIQKKRNEKKNKMKETKAKNNAKNICNKINNNVNFSFNNKCFNNQTPIEKEKEAKNNRNLSRGNYSLNELNKYKIENLKESKKNSIMNYIYNKKESIKNEIQKNRFKLKEPKKIPKKKDNKEKNTIKGKNAIKINNKKAIDKTKNTQNIFDKFKIENFNILIRDTKGTKDKNISILNDNSFYNKSATNQISPSKFDKNIEIQNISNISYNPKPDLLNTKVVLEKSQIINLNRPTISNGNETVAEKVRKLIMKKASLNHNKPSLSTKLNLNTDLTLTESERSGREYTNINKIKRNIKTSSKTIFCIYNKFDNVRILAFDYENKAFSFHDFSDFGNFEENYKLSLSNNNNGNILLNIEKYLYIITGKNYDMLYMFDSGSKTMNKLCELKYNHSNGRLIYYENNLICLSGDFNKSVEIYNIKKNTWNNMPEMVKERSGSGVCVLDNKYILNLFGYNSPTKQYLDNIEYFDITNKFNPMWKILECKNFVLKIKNFFCFNNNNKIILVGGSKHSENDKEKMKYNNNFIKIIFLEKNLEKIKQVKIEELIGKMKDINKNKNYLFLYGGKEYEEGKEISYEVFDSKYNCHVFKGINNTHDIFYSYL